MDCRISSLWNPVFIFLISLLSRSQAFTRGEMHFTIDRTWLGELSDDLYEVKMSAVRDFVNIAVRAPFFDDPVMPKDSPIHNLPDYEVIEFYFVGDDDRYVRITLSPNGKYLVTFFNGPGNAVRDDLVIEYPTPLIDRGQWTAAANIHSFMFPPNVTHFNIYGKHGRLEERFYLSLFPQTVDHGTRPNFNNIEFFGSIDFARLLPRNPYMSLSNDWRTALSSQRLEFQIMHTWDGEPVHHQFYRAQLEAKGTYIKVTVEGPFHNDPPTPPGDPGPLNQLWEYEVVEFFFLNGKDEYLEVELSPWGHHLVLLLKGQRNIIAKELPLDYTVTRQQGFWKGVAKIPIKYFPPKIIKFNMYAIFGSGDKRTYESLSYVPKGAYKEPDFHRLEYFKDIEFRRLDKFNEFPGYSLLWENIVYQNNAPSTRANVFAVASLPLISLISKCEL